MIFILSRNLNVSCRNTIIRPCKPSLRFVEFSTNTYLRTLRDYKTIKSIHITPGMSLIGMARQRQGPLIIVSITATAVIRQYRHYCQAQLQGPRAQSQNLMKNISIWGCPYITSAAITRQGQLECLRTLT